MRQTFNICHKDTFNFKFDTGIYSNNLENNFFQAASSLLGVFNKTFCYLTLTRVMGMLTIS